MMKVFLLVLLACVVGTLGQDGVNNIVGSWAGDTSTSSLTFQYPIPTNTPCNMAVSTSSYLVFNTTFTTSGVREVVGMFEPNFQGSAQVFLYNGTFNPTSSCTNLVRQLTNSNFGGAGVLSIDDPVYFAAGVTYIFVVTSTSTTNGKFVLQVWGSAASSATTATSPYWLPPVFVNNSVPCAPNSNTPVINQTFTVLTWTQPTAGNYDLVGIFDVASATGAPDPSVNWALYTGTFTVDQIAAGSCSGSLSSSYKITAQEGDRTATAWSVALLGNTPYTVAISNTYNGNAAINVFPTRLHAVTGTSGYTQPTTSTNTPTTCSASSGNTAPYYINPIASAAGPFYLFDTEDIPTYRAEKGFDTLSFAFSGAVTGNPPAACPTGSNYLGSADTGDSGPLVFSTTSGQAYTVIVSDFTGAALNASNTNSVYAYALTGTLVSSNATATSTTTTTGTTSATSSATSGAVTSGSSTSNTTATTSTSPASTLAVSAVLLFAGVLALLL